MRKGNFKILAGFNYFTPGWRSIGSLVLWLLVGAILGNIIVSILTFAVGQQFAVEYGTIISYPVMFLPAMFYARSRSMRNEMSFEPVECPVNKGHFAPVGVVLCALIVSVSTICCGIIVDPLVTLLPPMPEFLKNMLEGLTGGNIVLDLICVSVFAPFFEEWLCRGMVLRGLLGNNVKPVWAIVFSAAFFAIIHLNPWQAIPAFLLGLLFGYVYYKTRSLSLTMLMHCVNNTLAVVLGQIDSLKDMESWLDVMAPKAFWPLFAACVLLLVLCVRKIGSVNVVDAKDVSSAS